MGGLQRAALSLFSLDCCCVFTAVDRSLTDGSVPVPRADDQSLFDLEVELRIWMCVLRRPGGGMSSQRDGCDRPTTLPTVCSPAIYRPTPPQPNTGSFSSFRSGCLTTSYHWTRSGRVLYWLTLVVCLRLFDDSGVKCSLSKLKMVFLEAFFLSTMF